MAKWIAIIFGLLLLLTNGFWLYAAIDLAVTEKYAQQKDYETKNRIEALQALCSKLVGGMSRTSAVDLLNELSPDFEVYEKEGRLNTIWLSFEINEQGSINDNDACK